MSLDNLAAFGVGIHSGSQFIAYIIMKTGYADARLPGMIKFIIVAYFIKIMSVIINPDSYCGFFS